jgi:hypothetical protein
MSFTYMQEAALKKAWKALAEAHGGRFFYRSQETNDPFTGAEYNGPVCAYELNIPHCVSEIEIRVSDLRPLTFRFRFQSRLMFEFSVSREGLTEKIAKLFGGQDVEIGVREFDRKYLVETDAPRAFQSVFDKTVAEYLIQNSIFELTVHQPDEDYELYFACGQNRAADQEKMEDLIRFIKHTIDRVIEVNESL